MGEWQAEKYSLKTVVHLAASCFCLWRVAIPKHRTLLGEAIRKHRKECGLSQEKLAEISDLHHNYIGELERGEKAATIDSLLKIARALKIRVRDLVADV